MLTLVSTALCATYQHGGVPRGIPLTWLRLKLPEGEAKVNLASPPRARAGLLCVPPVHAPKSLHFFIAALRHSFRFIFSRGEIV